MINKTSCHICDSGYTKIQIKGPKDYCYEIAEELNCDVLESINFTNIKINCTQCKDGFAYAETSKVDKTVCLPFRQTDSCKQYDLQGTVQESNLYCIECEENYFLQPDRTCSIRTVKITRCVTYTIDDETCSVCDSGYFPSEDKSYCQKFPNGKKGCVSYSAETTCTECDVGLYLNEQDNICKEVDTIEPNCLFYHEDQACKLCENGFTEENGKCVEAQAQNCVTYESKIACSSCPINFGFKEESSIRSCVQKNIVNCEISEEHYPFKCLRCDKDFYSDDAGVCQEVSTSDLINKCQTYADKDTCSECQEGTVLSFDGKMCHNGTLYVLEMDQNCLINEIIEPACNVCK